jgi:cell division protein FtsB
LGKLGTSAKQARQGKSARAGNAGKTGSAGKAGNAARPDASRRRPSFTGRAAVLAVVLAALAIALAGPLRQLLSQRTQIAGLRAGVSAQQQQIATLEQQQKLWTDPAYIKAQARERLHYVMPGQVPYVTLAPTPAASANPSAVAAAADGPWYSQLWGSIKGAGAVVQPSPRITKPSMPPPAAATIAPSPSPTPRPSPGA